jgi:hypothetical protein
VKLSCIALTEPFEAAVVAVAHRAELAAPKRSSLPSRLPGVGSTPRVVSTGLPASSAQTHTARSPTNTAVIAASKAQPWRASLTSFPKV